MHDIEITDKEAQFKIAYEKCDRNATEAAMQTFDCSNRNSASTIGGRLVKKLGLEKPKAIVIRENRYDEQGMVKSSIQTDDIDMMNDDYKSGLVTFKELYNRVNEIAKKHKDGYLRLKANIRLQEMNEELEKTEQARNMAEKDVIDLLINSLSMIPREKYHSVLRGCRVRRLKLIKERRKKIDVEGIIEEEEQKSLLGGQNIFTK